MLLWDFEVARQLERVESDHPEVGYEYPSSDDDLPIGVAMAVISKWITDQKVNLLTFVEYGPYHIFNGRKRSDAIKKTLADSKIESDHYEQVSIDTML